MRVPLAASTLGCGPRQCCQHSDVWYPRHPCGYTLDGSSYTTIITFVFTFIVSV